MIKFKRALAALLVCAMAATLFACGGGNSSSSEPTTTDSAPAATATDDSSAGDKGLIAFANKGLDYYFWTTCQVSTQYEAEKLGYSFEATDAKLDSAKQFDQFVNFINKQPAAIVADSIDSEGLIAAADQAVAAGIPVGIVDTPLTGGDVAITVAFDNYDAGCLAAEACVKYLEEKYGEAKGTVINFYGAMSSEAWRLRKEGMEATFSEKYPNVTYIDVPAEGEIALTQDALLTQIASGKQIDVVHTPSDNPSQGLIAALKSENLWVTNEDEKHIGIVTIDGEPLSTKLIPEGYYDYTIAQDGYSYGIIAVDMLDQYSTKGEAVPLGKYENSDFYWEVCEIIDSASGPYCKVPAYEINKDNASDTRHWGIAAETVLGIPYDMSAAE